MVQRYARAACNECHLRLPKPHLHSVTKKEQTGSTGWGFSLGASVYEKKKTRADHRDIILQEKDIVLKHDGTAQNVLLLNILGKLPAAGLSQENKLNKKF